MNKRKLLRDARILAGLDNRLLESDGVQADLRRHPIGNVGRKRAKEYRRMFELLRAELQDYDGEEMKRQTESAKKLAANLLASEPDMGATSRLEIE